MSTRKARKSPASKKSIPDSDTFSSHVFENYPASQVETTESICEKARRLAKEEEAAKKAARLAKRQAFLDSMFKPNEYVLNEDGTYTICGWWWQLWTGGENEPPHLTFNKSPLACNWHNHNNRDNWPEPNVYRGIVLGRKSANNIVTLGQALQEIDEQTATIDRNYPNTFMGRIRLWMEVILWQ